jgi:hypothetical protein
VAKEISARCDNRAVRQPLIVTLAATMILTGCSVVVAPSPTAGALADVVNALVRRNMTITNQVAGDAGCADPTLQGNAVRYEVSMAGEVDAHPVYVFGWKDPASFGTAKGAFDACVENFSLTNRASSMATLEHAPWRAYLPNYSIQLTNAVDEALVEAGGAP